MTIQPVIAVAAAATIVNTRKVWEAQGLGPEAFSRRLTDDTTPTPSSTVTHYMMADDSCMVEMVAAWQAMAHGDLPQIDGVWGEDGVIGAADAMEATNSDNLQVYSASGNVVPLDHANAVLQSRGLHFVPDE